MHVKGIVCDFRCIHQDHVLFFNYNNNNNNNKNNNKNNNVAKFFERNKPCRIN